MKKFFNLILIAAVLIIFNSTVLKAGLVDELNYVNEQSDLYTYINFDKIINFISVKGIDIAELNSLIMSGSTKESDKILKEFGLELGDLNEFLMVMNTRDLEKKSGYLIFISSKNGKGNISYAFASIGYRLR